MPGLVGASDNPLVRVGARLRAEFTQYEADRYNLEQEWLKDWRQFKGVYESDVVIPEGRSQHYAKHTRIKVVGTVARLMEMLFPHTNEKNWSMTPTAVPNIPAAALQELLDGLEQQAQGQPLTSDMIETAVQAFAKAQAENMEQECLDQLQENNWPKLAKQILTSGVMYGLGTLKGPMVRLYPKRAWVPTEDGSFRASVEMVERPFFSFVPIWQYYPDLSAREFEQCDAHWERIILNRADLAALAQRPEFLSDVINNYLQMYSQGNYTEKSHESELRSASDDKTTVSNQSGRKYEVTTRWGYMSGHDLSALGVPVPDESLGAMFESDVWLLDNLPIKAVISPYEGDIELYHHFVYEEDEFSLVGQGIPRIGRGSQRAICAAARATLDNASAVAGPMVEENEDLLQASNDKSIHSFKVYKRTGMGVDAQYPAVRNITIDSHLPELLSVMRTFSELYDLETFTPPQAFGNAGSGSEQLRTTGNMSMVMGASNMVTKDTLRNWDFFTRSALTALYKWNLKFNPREDIRGDMEVKVNGAASLVAKEVRAQAIGYSKQSMRPEQSQHIDWNRFTDEEFKILDLPEGLVKTQGQVEQENAQAQQTAQREQDAKIATEEARGNKLTVDAQVKQQESAGNERRADNKSRIDTATSLSSALTEQNRGRIEAAKLLQEGRNARAVAE